MYGENKTAYPAFIKQKKFIKEQSIEIRVGDDMHARRKIDLPSKSLAHITDYAKHDKATYMDKRS